MEKKERGSRGSSGLWVIPYFIAGIAWIAIYRTPISMVSLYFAGKQNPLVFILMIGMFLHMIVGIIGELYQRR